MPFLDPNVVRLCAVDDHFSCHVLFMIPRYELKQLHLLLRIELNTQRARVYNLIQN